MTTTTSSKGRFGVCHTGAMLVLLILAGCGHQMVPTGPPTVDLSLVDCGYKWFQTGYSPVTDADCNASRDELRGELTQAALAHAWETGQLRCPATCPPRELKDTVEWRHPEPDGVCRDGRIYFFTRVFLQCGSSLLPATRSEN